MQLIDQRTQFSMVSFSIKIFQCNAHKVSKRKFKILRSRNVMETVQISIIFFQSSIISKKFKNSHLLHASPPGSTLLGQTIAYRLQLLPPIRHHLRGGFERATRLQVGLHLVRLHVVLRDGAEMTEHVGNDGESGGGAVEPAVLTDWRRIAKIAILTLSLTKESCMGQFGTKIVKMFNKNSINMFFNFEIFLLDRYHRLRHRFINTFHQRTNQYPVINAILRQLACWTEPQR